MKILSELRGGQAFQVAPEEQDDRFEGMVFYAIGMEESARVAKGHELDILDLAIKAVSREEYRLLYCPETGTIIPMLRDTKVHVVAPAGNKQ